MSDVMHSFDLYQPSSLDEAAKLLDTHGKKSLDISWWKGQL